MILHIFQESPFSTQTLSNSLSSIGSKDGVLLCQDAVLALRHEQLQSVLESLDSVYVLVTDANALGFTNFPHWAKPVDYNSMVELVVQYDKSITW